MTPAAGAAAAAPPGERSGWGAWLLRFGAAFMVLNALLTFENAGASLAVRLAPRLSFELCLGVLALLLWVAWRGRVGERGLGVLAWIYTGLVLTRYADVTVPALFGRPVHLYWDGRHAWELLQLAAASLPVWRWVAGGALAVLLLVLLQRTLRWAMTSLAHSLQQHPPRPWLLTAGLALTVSFAVHPYVGPDTRWFFSLPVSPTLARQAVLLPAALSPREADTRLTPSPAFDTDLARLRGADVLLMFAEAYGVTSLDDPLQARALAPARAQLAQAAQQSGRQVVSARVRSPTFAGSSWLAHAALLSGVDTRDPDDHDLLLTTRRPTLVSHFARFGYRTVGWMPGLQKPWPEGAFYGFDRLADLDRLGYRGPPVGYWRVPDQASMALLQAQELSLDRSRPPRFIVFPTLTSHVPFRPVAPYQPDWTRLLGEEAYDTAQLAPALAAPASWLNPVPAYVDSLNYTFQWLTGYLRDLAPPNLLLIVIGDHQPVAGVTGANASWDVPVHVFSSDAALLQRFEALGFEPGLTPAAAHLGGMHELTRLLLAAFDGAAADPGIALGERPRMDVSRWGAGRASMPPVPPLSCATPTPMSPLQAFADLRPATAAPLCRKPDAIDRRIAQGGEGHESRHR